MIKTIKQVFRAWAGKHPGVFYTVYPLKTKNKKLCFNRSTELVIEGFPRSANTYSVVAFEMAQTRKVKIAHHLHVPAQIMKAVKNNIPVIVLIREPVEAVSSLLVRHPHLNMKMCFKEYIGFYDSIYKYRGKYVVGEFSEVISNFQSVIQEVNDKFNTCFEIINGAEKHVEAVFYNVEKINDEENGSMSQVARPSEYKNNLKKVVLKEMEAEGISALVLDAKGVFKRFVE